MQKTELFKKTAILLFIIGVLNVIAEVFYFYWTVWWYDILLHFMGGVCAAMFVMSVYSYYFNKDPKRSYKLFTNVLVYVLMIGIVWEIYELYFNLTTLNDGNAYIKDTTTDIIADMFGAIAGYHYSFYVFKKMNDRI